MFRPGTSIYQLRAHVRMQSLHDGTRRTRLYNTYYMYMYNTRTTVVKERKFAYYFHE